MTKLIDVQKATRLLRGQCVAKYPNSFMLGLFAAADELAKMKPVDAVEAVHCGSCVWACDETAEGWMWCNQWCNSTTCDGYCHKGKRKDND